MTEGFNVVLFAISLIVVIITFGFMVATESPKKEQPSKPKNGKPAKSSKKKSVSERKRFKTY
tara:strand:- start:429 stop:614 length:186 start_codon:yes stop_codon:yes gene_type:complete